MVLPCGLKLPTGCASSGASKEVQAKVSHYLCPAGATQHELQSDMQMDIICAGLGVTKADCLQFWGLLVRGM